MSQSVRARAYASIGNVGHGFDVFGMCVDVAHDEVEVSRGGAGLELALGGAGAAGIPADPAANTAGRAIMAMRERHALSGPLRVHVQKGTRSGSGLGSSAASAAAAVVAVDALFGLRLSKPELVLFAAEGERASAGAAHTDNVAAAIYGGFVVFCNETPPRVSHVTPPASLRFVLTLPDVRIHTLDARAVLPGHVSVADYSRGTARAALSAFALVEGDVRRFGEVIEGSIFEASRAKLLPGFAEACAAARRAGAYGCVMSGAGPAVAAVIDGRVDAAAVAKAIENAFATAGVKSECFFASPGPAARVVEAIA